ncbi:Myb/SANT-like transcription factor, partial [Oryctes borbonicus]
MMSISDSEEFNVKCFIEEVRKRPELWDSSHEEYKNREQRQNAWLDICSVFIQGFKEKETEEQLIGGRELQQKWKYIRDAYTRQVRLAALKGLGEGSNKYIYGKYLRFLNVSSMENKRRNWSPPSTSEVSASNNVKT